MITSIFSPQPRNMKCLFLFCCVILRLSKTTIPIPERNVTKVNEMTVFLAITSAPWYWHLRDGARDTWLTPCLASPYCDYRFFVDKTLQSVSAVMLEAGQKGQLGKNRTTQTNVTITLAEEFTMHKDLVFRADWCQYIIDRHPEGINYGNVFKKHWVYGGGGVKYYNLRGMYKVDWKICFMKWARQNYAILPLYHVFVEDDFFVCTEHLLYQTTLLRNLPPDQRKFSFRTGFPMWDGFDDSSSFLTRDIVQVFADNYPLDHFNCTSLADSGDPSPKYLLSWGNSWRGQNCAWRDELKKFNITVNAPYLSKGFLTPWCVPTPPKPHWANRSSAPTQLPTMAPSPGGLFTASPTLNYSKALFPCPRDHIMILHNNAGGDIMATDPLLKHSCEYMLLVDKVKDTTQMWTIYNATTSYRNNYHDFSDVLRNDGVVGWNIVLKSLTDKEKTCPLKHNDTNKNSTATVDGKVDYEGLSNECFKWRRRRLRRSRRLLSTLVYDTTTTNHSFSSTLASSSLWTSSTSSSSSSFGTDNEHIDENDIDDDDPGVTAYYADLIEQLGIR